MVGRFLIAVAGLLMFAVSTQAQKCQVQVSVSDYYCEDNTQCLQSPELGNCQSVAFTAPCTETYRIYASSSCSAPYNCEDCLSVAYLYNADTGERVDCVHNACGQNGFCVSPPLDVPLVAHVNYKLYACKIDCPAINGGCSACPDGESGCYVSAKLFLLNE